jgi:hypothetical protein
MMVFNDERLVVLRNHASAPRGNDDDCVMCVQFVPPPQPLAMNVFELNRTQWKIPSIYTVCARGHVCVSWGRVRVWRALMSPQRPAPFTIQHALTIPQDIALIGGGSFGQVIGATDTLTGRCTSQLDLSTCMVPCIQLHLRHTDTCLHTSPMYTYMYITLTLLTSHDIS